MGKCEGCGVSMHVPSCRVEVEDADDEVALSLLAREEQMKMKPLCTNCRAEGVVADEEEEKLGLKKGKKRLGRSDSNALSSTGGKRRRGRSMDEAENMNDSIENSDLAAFSLQRGQRAPGKGGNRGGRGRGRGSRGGRGGRSRLIASPNDRSVEEVVDDENDEPYVDGEDGSSSRKRSRSPKLLASLEGIEAVQGDPTPKRRKPGRPPLTPEEKEARKEERKRIKRLEAMLRKEAAEEERNGATVASAPETGMTPPSNESNELQAAGANEYGNEEGVVTLADGSTLDVDTHTAILSNLRAEKPTRATPGFFFFLSDHRLRIERHLTKRDRTFKTTRIGSLERNELIAKEGAVMWLSTEYEERKRYIEMSLNDFQKRIVAWKEEEHIREMLSTGEDDTAGLDGTGGDTGDPSGQVADEGDSIGLDDDGHWRNRHARLISASRIRCRPHDDSGEKKRRSRNRILLDILQDSRFHSLPMIDPSRLLSDFVDLSQRSKMTVPFFTVQGPVATGLGDECLGCQRGWDHFCPVLNRQFPAVEHRAKLQPPLSTLIATRIGLGSVRVPSQKCEVVEKIPSTVKEIREQMRNPSQKDRFTSAPSCYLNMPDSRYDDVVHFVEAAAQVKISEAAFNSSTTNAEEANEAPNNTPSAPESPKTKALSRGILPTRGKRRPSDASVSLFEEAGSSSFPSEAKMWQCGRCDSVTRMANGCISCRRSHLVAEMARHGYSGAISVGKAAASEEGGANPADSGGKEEHEGGYLTIASIMLGREPLKHSNFERQQSGQRLIASAVTTSPWKPNAVLPPKDFASSLLSSHSNEIKQVDGGDNNDGEGSIQSGVGDNSAAEDDSDSGAVNGTNPSEEAPMAGEVIDGSLDEHSKEEDSGINGPKELSVDAPLVDEDVKMAPQAKSSPPSSRLRGSRDSVTNSASAPETEQDRQVIAEAHKEEADELLRKCVFTACCGILLSLLRRDPLRLFAEPVPPSVEGYTKMIKRPIDFGVVRRRVLKGRYTTLKSFVQDARLLCANALVFNPEGSIYAITAKDIFESLEVMQKRASFWISTMKNAHSSHFSKFGRRPSRDIDESQKGGSWDPENETNATRDEDDPFKELRVSWPGAAEMLDQVDYLRSQLRSDFLRTRENESAYFGALAVKRIAAAAEASLASTPDSGGIHEPSVRRNFKSDEALRDHIDESVADVNGPVQLRDEPSWREESVLRFLRNVQSRRIEMRTSSESGCARCDGIRSDAEEAKLATREATMRRRRRSDGVRPRVHESRIGRSTGLASANARQRVANEAKAGEDTLRTTAGEIITATARDKSVSVRGSRIHGWGLYTDHPFKKGEIVAEYVGEFVGNAVADAREKMYRRMRIQDYQFRVSNDLVIDATLQGGHARYINHSCDPNCAAKIIDGAPPNKELKRVIIVSQRNIPAMEEITYDYQFPLELDLMKRIPCNCGSKLCRGFMNWDLPEVGSKTTRYQMMKASRARDRASRKSSGRGASARRLCASKL